MSAPRTRAFRERYRAGISRFYSPVLHAGFVLAYGGGCIALFLRSLDEVAPLAWLTVPLTLVFFNWGEYAIHKHLGHARRRLGTLFYKRHTGDHHSFFVDDEMAYEEPRDFRVILFPAWLVVLVSAGLFPAHLALATLDANVASLFAATMMAGYLSYELFHAAEHLPAHHPLARLPWVRRMRRLHALHHRPGEMREQNFNLVFPLMDRLYGTLREAHHEEAPRHE